ncbi:MAG: hypothetical protein P4N60_05425, partial [Verrucomicrobiae bacterium]|nr:hypothetical protein [Verrucomicrobiae bacterium]
MATRCGWAAPQPRSIGFRAFAASGISEFLPFYYFELFFQLDSLCPSDGGKMGEIWLLERLIG